jgi:hypothetical protein
MKNFNKIESYQLIRGWDELTAEQRGLIEDASPKDRKAMIRRMMLDYLESYDEDDN